MRWIARVSVVLIGIICGFIAMPVLKSESGDRVAKRVHYVALGDSIAHGYGLSNPKKDSYVGQVETFLEKKYDAVSASNFGVDGMQSEDLIDCLTNPENENYRTYTATLHYADVITLSIGSNDLLHLLRVDMDIQNYIENGDAMFCDACNQFAENFPKIIAVLHKLAPKASIYVNNIYNPCHGLKKYQDLYQTAEYYIDKINTTLKQNQGFTLVNVKKVFDESDEELLNMSLQGRGIDPHPNKNGHEKIGKTVISAMEEK